MPLPGRAASASATGSSAHWDLVEIGLMSAEEAKELHEMETAAAGS